MGSGFAFLARSSAASATSISFLFFFSDVSTCLFSGCAGSLLHVDFIVTGESGLLFTAVSGLLAALASCWAERGLAVCAQGYLQMHGLPPRHMPSSQTRHWQAGS